MMYPTGLAVNAVAAPFAPMVVTVVGLASVKSPIKIGRFNTGLFCSSIIRVLDISLDKEFLAMQTALAAVP